MSFLWEKGIWLDSRLVNHEPEFSQKKFCVDENLDLKTVKIVIFRKKYFNEKNPNNGFCVRFLRRRMGQSAAFLRQMDSDLSLQQIMFFFDNFKTLFKDLKYNI
jgi:hypothetical protein